MQNSLLSDRRSLFPYNQFPANSTDAHTHKTCSLYTINMYVNHIAVSLILIIIIHRPVLSPPAYPLFNRSGRNTLRPSNYNNLQRREVNPQNPTRNRQATSTDSASTSASDDLSSANDANGGEYNEEDEDTTMVDTEAPKIDPELTQEENRKRFALYYARKDKR